MGIGNKVPSITVESLKEQLNESPMIIDIRQPDAYVQGHIQGAKNITAERLSQLKVAVGETVYVVCYAGMSSQQVTKELNARNINAVSIEGGMAMWDGDLVKGFK